MLRILRKSKTPSTVFTPPRLQAAFREQQSGWKYQNSHRNRVAACGSRSACRAPMIGIGKVVLNTSLSFRPGRYNHTPLRLYFPQPSQFRRRNRSYGKSPQRPYRRPANDPRFAIWKLLLILFSFFLLLLVTCRVIPILPFPIETRKEETKKFLVSIVNSSSRPWIEHSPGRGPLILILHFL